MSSAYIIFERIEVQGANCIAGFTYGFPAITHFLGFARALSRQLSQRDQLLKLQGCAVICHQHQIQAYQPKKYSDYVFAQTRNPLKKDKKTAPIVEEGKMSMCVSLIMECPDFTRSREVEVRKFKEDLISLAYQHRLAGGSIHKIKAAHVHSEQTEPEQQIKQIRQIKRALLPGFVLMDRSDLLAEHYQNRQKTQPTARLIDAWLDFSIIKYEARPILEDGQVKADSKTKAEWERLEKPAKGWLMPITTGYKAIDRLYQPGELANARSSDYPFSFVESVHSIGEWRSLHRIQQIRDILWQYHDEADWYLCRQQPLNEEYPEAIQADAEDIELKDDFLNSL